MAIISDELVDTLLGDPNGKTVEDLFGKDGILKQLSARMIERILEAEMTHHLGYKKHATEGNNSGNSRNGKIQKTVKTGNGDILINVPRDRNAEFEPHLVGKRQSRLGLLDDKILSLYARGMTVRDIQELIEEQYGSSISKELISNITDSVVDEINEWSNRPLENIYPIVYIDGFVAKCRLEGHVCNRTVYVVFGINLEGYKEVLGLYIGAEEGAKYWLSVLTEIKNRGVNDIFILCADGLKGLPEAVVAAFPKTTFQTCIVHMVRNSLKYVPYQEKKAVASDLKKIYQADTVKLAEKALDEFEATWGKKYGSIVNSWRNNWTKIIPFFDFSKEIRKVIYTTNIIESLNSTFRKAVRNRGHFTNENSLMKVLYLAMKGVSKKWKMPIRDWKNAMNQMLIIYEDRFKVKLE